MAPFAPTSLLLALTSSSRSVDPSNPPLSPDTMHVTALSRFAVKGLSPDHLQSVYLSSSGETFPDDRRYALLKRTKESAFDERNPKWVHKENFLCAFTAPELLAGFETQYRIEGVDEGESYASADTLSPEGDEAGTKKRLLTVWRRSPSDPSVRSTKLLGPIDLTTDDGRTQTAQFFSDQSGEEVVCVTADPPKPLLPTQDNGSGHTHQFGNTRSGVKDRDDTRTVHLVNAATVRQLSERIGIDLSPFRFRPNIIVDGLEPWAEFEFVGKTLVVHSGDSKGKMKLDVVSRTVRCAGIGVDPLDPSVGVLDIPKLLTEHFPEHGPFLGVYACVRERGWLGLGDTITVEET